MVIMMTINIDSRTLVSRKIFMEAECCLEYELMSIDGNPSWLRRVKKHLNHTKFTESALKDFIEVCERLMIRFSTEAPCKCNPSVIGDILRNMTIQLSLLWRNDDIIFDKEEVN